MSENEDFAARFAARVHQKRTKLYTLTGRLVREKAELLLMLDDGGFWVLEGPWRLHSCIGKRMVVEGRRTGFNSINVERFKL